MRSARRRNLPDRASFAIISFATLVVSVVVGIPAPLNPTFEARFGIDPAVFTAAFATYVVCAAASMLLAGRLSDVVGRRPVSALALAFSLASCLAFLVVRDPATYVVARALAGLGVGIGMPALGAFVVDLAPPQWEWAGALVTSAAAPLGVAMGALVSGGLVQLAPWPNSLGFALGVILVGLSLVGIWIVPETVSEVERASRGSVADSLVPRIAVPRRLRVMFVGSSLCFVSCWSLGGLFQSLGASIARENLALEGGIAQGAVASTIIGTSALGGLLAGRLTIRAGLGVGVSCFVLGVGSIAVTVHVGNGSAFLAACVLAGLGFGAAFNACMRALLDTATAAETASVLSAVYLVGFLGSAAPNAVAGVLIAHTGLVAIVTVYAAGTGLLVLTAGLVVDAQLRSRAALIHDGSAP